MSRPGPARTAGGGVRTGGAGTATAAGLPWGGGLSSNLSGFRGGSIGLSVRTADGGGTFFGLVFDDVVGTALTAADLAGIFTGFLTGPVTLGAGLFWTA